MSGAVQTSVGTNPAPGAPGALYDLGPHEIISRIASEAISFGSWVNLSGENCELPDNSTEVTAAQGGIALIDESKASGVGYEAGDIVRVLRKGRVWVDPEDTVTAGSPAFVRHTATLPEVKGSFRSDADTADASTPPTAYYFAVISGMAVVELNQPGGATGAGGPTGSGGATGATGPTGPAGP